MKKHLVIYMALLAISGCDRLPDITDVRLMLTDSDPIWFVETVNHKWSDLHRWEAPFNATTPFSTDLQIIRIPYGRPRTTMDEVQLLPQREPSSRFTEFNYTYGPDALGGWGLGFQLFEFHQYAAAYRTPIMTSPYPTDEAIPPILAALWGCTGITGQGWFSGCAPWYAFVMAGDVYCETVKGVVLSRDKCALYVPHTEWSAKSQTFPMRAFQILPVQPGTLADQLALWLYEVRSTDANNFKRIE